MYIITCMGIQQGEILPRGIWHNLQSDAQHIVGSHQIPQGVPLAQSEAIRGHEWRKRARKPCFTSTSMLHMLNGLFKGVGILTVWVYFGRYNDTAEGDRSPCTMLWLSIEWSADNCKRTGTWSAKTTRNDHNNMAENTHIPPPHTHTHTHTW
jgi:hypothetical protein